MNKTPESIAACFDVVCVVIGRNEGRRLVDCLFSIDKAGGRNIVYVDSGSTDGSVQSALTQGCVVVELNMKQPFTAARARNAGVEQALSHSANAAYLQFLDGDCLLDIEWMQKAQEFLNTHPDYAAVCGRRRERYPERSIYNQLCDIEWNTPTGDAKSFGGDVMIRAEAFKALGGYKESLIAGEEPELCVRLRQKGWKIHRMDAEMTLHDAAMTRFGQWWKRSVRAGHAFAEGAFLHGAPPELHWVKEHRSAMVWGLYLPVLIFLLIALLGPLGLLALVIYPLQFARMYARNRNRVPIAAVYSFMLLLGKFPEMLGGLKYIKNRVFNQRAKLIEYK